MQPCSFEQTLVLASILEKPIHLRIVKELQVFLNRLSHNQRLQVDASTIAAFHDEYARGSSVEVNKALSPYEYIPS